MEKGRLNMMNEKESNEKKEDSLRERLKDNFVVALRKEIRRKFCCPECNFLFLDCQGQYPEICPECGWVQLGTRSVFE